MGGRGRTATAPSHFKRNRNAEHRHSGNNFAFDLHQYLDSDGSGTHTSIGGKANPSDAANDPNPSELGRDRLTQVTDWLIANHRRGFLGETAVDNSMIGNGVNQIGDETLTNMLDYMKDPSGNGSTPWLGFTWWGGGPWWGNNSTFHIDPVNGADQADMNFLVNGNFLANVPQSSYASLGADLDTTTGQLNIRGTPDNDSISLSVSGLNLVARINGRSLNFLQSDVKRISIFTLSGNDKVVLNAGVGAAYINGGDGDDTLYGNSGDDRIDGMGGNDLIKGNDGDDSITGGDGNDTIYGQIGNDFLQGGNGNDKIVGGDGNDRMFGDAGNDRLYGQAGIDSIEGGSGSNYIVPD